MFLSSRGTFALVIILSIYTVLQAQSGNGVNSTGTAGNEIIQGKIYFPSGHKSNMRPVVKLQSDSSSELTTVANFDGSFSFTHLRPDSYKIIVNGGNEFENAFETVSVGSAGPVPAQGNPGQYAMPVIYQVQIYLQPKKTLGFDPSDSATRAALANVSKTARELFNKALESARLGQSKKAIEQFKQAISQAPNFALAYNEMGTLYLKLGRADEAVDALAAAVKLEPEQFAARLNYGIALLNLNKFADAEKELRQALQKNGAAPIAHYYLGLTLMKQRQFDSAQAEFETSIRNSKDGIALAHKYLGGIYWHNNQYGRAADELERYIVLVPKAPDAAKIRDTIKDLRSKQ